MRLLKEFRDFAMKGNVVDLAVAVIIGTAFGKIVTSLVEDVLMPPVGKLVGNLDFSNLYVSLSDKIDAANTAKHAEVAATQPATTQSMVSGVTELFDTATRLPLAEARKLGPVIAYGNFLTITINFIIVALCIFAIVKMMTVAQKRFDKDQAKAEAAAPPTKEEVLLTEIRDLLKQRT
jgi:large conductance mechanosensitive channel